MRPLLVLIFLMFPVFVQGQSELDLTATQSALVVQPSHPGPFDDFTVSLDDYSGGAYGASINWIIDGIEQPEAKNNRSISLATGAAGTTLTVDVVLRFDNQTSQTLTATIRPYYLDIIFEPQTHVPSFYKGRALPSPGSLVNATALLHDTPFASGDIIYRWQIGRQVINAGPVRGQNKISFIAPGGKESIVSLEATSPSGAVLAKRSMLIPLVTPELHFYEVNTLYGVLPRALSKLLLIGNSTTLVAVPYYLDSRVYNQPDVLTWELNREQYSSQSSNPYEITLQRLSFGGSSRLEFHVRSTTNFLQGVKSNLEINY